jgi:hypothetical protein
MYILYLNIVNHLFILFTLFSTYIKNFDKNQKILKSKFENQIIRYNAFI